VKVKSLKALEILDSRGNPTVRTFVELEDGSMYGSSVPSGASTSSYEAVELRDVDDKRHSGQGVQKAVYNVEIIINKVVAGMEITDPKNIDEAMIEADGTGNKSKLGANAILSVSQAVLKAAARSQKMPLWKFINQYYFADILPAFPRLMVNIVNGGKHANWNFDIQEFMIIPKQNLPMQALQIAAEVFHSLAVVLKEKGLTTLLGDEGGYSPALNSNEEVLDIILEAAHKANYSLVDFDLGLDSAASGWFEGGNYISHKNHHHLNSQGLIDYYLKLHAKYEIASFEDPFSEDDWDAFVAFTKHAKDFMVVGDDLYATNPARIEKGIDLQATNAVLIKVNQIGTVLETVQAIKIAKSVGWKTIISHRSGETEDSFITDLTYASGAEFIKTGSVARSERLAKYNRLLEIEKGL